MRAPSDTPNVAKEVAAKFKEKDPDYFRKLGRLGGKARLKPYYHFRELAKSDPEKLRHISAEAGKKSRRGKNV